MKPLLAKPVGITLEEHTRNVLGQARELIAARPFVGRKYKSMTGHDLAGLTLQSAEWHDVGKEYPRWQNACRQEYDEYIRTGKVNGQYLLKAGIRHEFASLVYLRSRSNIREPLIEVAIAAHHGKLGHRYEQRWTHDDKQFWPFWEEMCKRGSYKENDIQGFEEAVLCRYEAAGPRMWLQMADHRASAGEHSEQETGDQLPAYKDFSYNFRHDEKRGVQKVIEELWNEPFAILRAATGAGKTDAALLWAQYQINSGRADRLVIAMPTRFTANALSINVAEALSETGLYHSSAWFQKLKDAGSLSEERLLGKELEMARLLETSVTVTTIDHLCMCLTGARESHHGTFFNLAHSCVVIDEADFYDPFTQQNIVVLLHVLRLLHVPVLLMSATVPQSAKQLYAASGFTINAIYEDQTGTDINRWSITRSGKAALPGDIENVLNKGLKGIPLIIYANTVQRAQAYYDWFHARGCSDVILYHSRFTEPHKARKEETLLQMLGKEAWKNHKQYGVAILTQIGELSVNISTDLMLSDLCPLDRLAQRAGRLSRFTDFSVQQKQGELYVVEPTRPDKPDTLYPAPYGHYCQRTRKWIASDYLIQSGTLLRSGKYSPQDFTNLVDILYAEIQEIESDIRKNVRALQDCICTNWMILPAQHVEEDDERTKEWKSRDIPPQKTVIVDSTIGIVDNNDSWTFRNRSQYRQYVLLHGIQIPAYEFERAKKEQFIEKTTVIVGDEDREILWIVRPNYYSEERGLYFQFIKDEEE